jgi:hypothetical protein
MNLISNHAPHFLRRLKLYPEMVIVLASDAGLSILQKCRNNLFFIDGTHLLLEGKMQLAGIAVKDDFGL